MNTRDLLALKDAQLRRELAREQSSNRVFAARCPGVHETDCYRRGPLSQSSFYTTADWLRACITREHARFNPARCAAPRGALHRKY
jgi:hypothetical protein